MCRQSAWGKIGQSINNDHEKHSKKTSEKNGIHLQKCKSTDQINNRTYYYKYGSDNNIDHNGQYQRCHLTTTEHALAQDLGKCVPVFLADGKTFPIGHKGHIAFDFF